MVLHKKQILRFFCWCMETMAWRTFVKNLEKRNRVRTVETDLFAFLTTFPNDIVKPYHPKSMPVILSTPEEVSNWFLEGYETVKKAQKPLENNLLSCLN